MPLHLLPPCACAPPTNLQMKLIRSLRFQVATVYGYWPENEGDGAANKIREISNFHISNDHYSIAVLCYTHLFLVDNTLRAPFNWAGALCVVQVMCRSAVGRIMLLRSVPWHCNFYSYQCIYPWGMPRELEVWRKWFLWGERQLTRSYYWNYHQTYFWDFGERRKQWVPKSIHQPSETYFRSLSKRSWPRHHLESSKEGANHI